MDDIIFNSCIAVDKKSLLVNGVNYFLEPLSHTLINKSLDKLVDYLCTDLQDTTTFQFIIQIKKIEVE